jgi:hypothetical protein
MQNVGTFMAFMEAFLGPDTPPEDDDRLPLDDLVGEYRAELRAYGSVMEFIEVLSGGTVMNIERSGEDGLLIGGMGPYRQTAKGVFWGDSMPARIDGGFTDTSLWTFSWDKDEERYYLSPRLGITPLVKVGTFDNPAFYSQLFAFGLLILLTGLVAQFWRVQTSATRYVKYEDIFTPVFIILVPVVLMLGYPEGDTPAAYLSRGDSGRFVLSIVFANLAALGCVTLIFGSVRSWLSPDGVGLIRRIHLSLLGMAAIAMLMAFYFSNYIGVNLP